jgi:hypothetical protein
MNEFEDKWIWIFHGENATYCTAAFTEKEKAELWIFEHSLSGTLTRMPVNKSIYDWAIEFDLFVPKKEYQKTGSFIQRFSSAYLEHSHYCNGRNVSD